jgi:hypothetical protein
MVCGDTSTWMFENAIVAVWFDDLKIYSFSRLTAAWP